MNLNLCQFLALCSTVSTLPDRLRGWMDDLTKMGPDSDYLSERPLEELRLLVGDLDRLQASLEGMGLQSTGPCSNEDEVELGATLDGDLFLAREELLSTIDTLELYEELSGS